MLALDMAIDFTETQFWTRANGAVMASVPLCTTLSPARNTRLISVPRTDKPVEFNLHLPRPLSGYSNLLGLVVDCQRLATRFLADPHARRQVRRSRVNLRAEVAAIRCGIGCAESLGINPRAAFDC